VNLQQNYKIKIIMNNQEIFDNLIKDINWGNWEKEKHEEDEQTEYFDLCEVFYNKLEWVKENLLEDEHIDTIIQVQELLLLLNENKIKTIL
jgi:hypothetical protein